MKFALNGALTIGTLDGANVEIMSVLTISLFLVTQRKKWKNCVVKAKKPREYYEKDEELHQVLTQIGSGVFSPEESGSLSRSG